MTHQYVTKLVKLSNGDDVVGEVDISSLRTSEIKIKNPPLKGTFFFPKKFWWLSPVWLGRKLDFLINSLTG